MALHRWKREKVDAHIADGYLSRVQSGIGALRVSAIADPPLDGLVAGLWTLTFEHRILIAWDVNRKVVTVQRVINAFRDLGRMHRES